MLKFITEAMGWLQILIFPTFVGLGIGAWIYLSDQTTTRLIIGILIAILGLILGILWATKLWRTKGTTSFLSKISATPDIDQKDGDVLKNMK